MKQLLPWKSSITYFRVRVRVRAHVFFSGEGGVGALAWSSACSHVALLIQYATQASYCLWPLWRNQIFQHYLINSMIFRKICWT